MSMDYSTLPKASAITVLLRIRQSSYIGVDMRLTIGIHFVQTKQKYK